MQTTLYTRLGEQLITVSGRTPASNPNRNGQRYEKLLGKQGLRLEDVTTFMEIKHVGREILFSYTFSEKDGGWIIGISHGRSSVCYGPMSYEESIDETLDVCRRLGVCN